MNGRRLTDDFAYAAFSSFSFTDDSLLFQFTFFDITSPGEYVQDCAVALGRHIGRVNCTAPELAAE